MAILTQTIIDRMAAALDAENSERYLFDNDYKPAINHAIEWIIQLYNAVFASKKVSEESLRELVKVGVFVASKYNRITYDVPNEKLWSVIAVFPYINAVDQSKVYLPGDGLGYSPTKCYQKQIAFTGSDFIAKRLTLEEFNLNKKNPMEAGSTLVASQELKQYAFVNFAEYSHLNSTYPVYGTDRFEIEISPSVTDELVAVSYLKKPGTINTVNDIIEFPDTVTNMIVEEALRMISFKQGDQTTLSGDTAKGISELIKIST